MFDYISAAHIPVVIDKGLERQKLKRFLLERRDKLLGLLRMAFDDEGEREAIGRNLLAIEKELDILQVRY